MARTPTSQPPTGRSGGTRSYWVKSLGPPGGEPASAEADAAATRFVEPFRFDTKQRNSMLALMRRLRIGDTDGREIFMVAIAYDLAAYKQQQTSEPAPEPETPATPQTAEPEGLGMGPMASAIAALCEQIDTLDEGARERLVAELQRGDRFKRGYDSRYLTELRGELDLLAQVCATPTAAAAPAEPPPPALSPQARHLLGRLANAYQDCFEDPPTPDPAGPFAQLVGLLCEIAAIDLPRDGDSLSQALAEP